MSKLVVVGLSHRTAPIEVRERVAFADEALPSALKQAVTAGVSEAMIVSTCNRVELYADGEIEAARRFLVENRTISAQQLYAHEGEGALTHLFRVAASLDSMVVGEPQILGQVKQAFALAVDAGTIGPLLGKALPRAFAVAKRVRTETEIARTSASIASAAVELAEQIFGSLQGRRVMVVGAGKMGALSARHLRAAGIGELAVVNRTRARAESLAAQLGGRAESWDDLDKLLTKVDIVICSTGAAQPVIEVARVKQAMHARKGRWLFFIDIAVPRDVAPEVGQLENVYLYDVDELEKVVAGNRAGRQREADEAEAIVVEEVRRFAALEKTQSVVPVIKALRGKFLQVARAEAERAAGKMESERDRAQLQQLAEAIANKLLHAPLTELKRQSDHALAETICRLFDLTVEEEAEILRLTKEQK